MRGFARRLLAASLLAEAATLCGASAVQADPLAAVAAPAEEGSDWPDFLGPQRNGKSTEKGLDLDWPDAGPPVKWTVALGAGYGAPAVSRGKVYHFERYGQEDRLICREAETGRELWSAASPTQYSDLLGYNNGPRCSPVVDDDRVYTFSAEGLLQCFRADTGEAVWKVDTRADFHVVQNFFGVGSTPLVFGDTLIVNVGGSPPGGPPDIYTARGRVASSGAGVVAFNKHDGSVAWQASDELASYASPVVATIDDRPWCFAFARGGLVALDPRNGKVDFHYPWRSELLESANASTPVVVGREVFISETYGVGSSLLRVRPEAYDVVWSDQRQTRQKAMMLHWNTPVHHAGFLYGSSGRHQSGAELRCIEWSTGNVRWSQPALGRCSLLYVDGSLICLSENGSLHLIRANPERFDLVKSVVLQDAEGEELVNPPAWAAPVLARGLLYVRGDDRLVCLDLRP